MLYSDKYYDRIVLYSQDSSWVAKLRVNQRKGNQYLQACVYSNPILNDAIDEIDEMSLFLFLIVANFILVTL